MRNHERLRYSHIDACGAIQWSHPINKNRVAWWRVIPGMGGGSRLQDLVGRSHGTLTNFSATQNPWRGQDSSSLFSGCLSFDGTNDVVLVPSGFGSLYTTAELTAQAWIKPNSLASLQAVVGEDSSGNVSTFMLEVGRTANRVSVVWNNTLIHTGSTNLVAGVWSHIACVRSGSSGAWTSTIYVNGTLDSTAASGTNPTTGGVFAIGGRTSSGSAAYGGSIGEVVIDRRSLRAAEIKTQYLQANYGYQVSNSLLRWVSSRSYFSSGIAANFAFVPFGGGNQPFPTCFTPLGTR